jgi:hypothetical protein
MKRLIISIMATIMCAFGAVAVITNFTTTGANAVEESHSLAWNGKRGADNLPCTGGTLLWIFTGQGATSATLYLNGNAYPGDQMGNHGSYHFTTPGTGVTKTSSAVVQYTGPVQTNAVVTISHCDGGGQSSSPPPSTDSPPSTS